MNLISRLYAWWTSTPEPVAEAICTNKPVMPIELAHFEFQAGMLCNKYKQEGEYFPCAYGDWSVYYGEQQHSRGMSAEQALMYARMFNAPCIVAIQGKHMGTVVGNDKFNQERYDKFDKPQLLQCQEIAAQKRRERESTDLGVTLETLIHA